MAIAPLSIKIIVQEIQMLYFVEMMLKLVLNYNKCNILQSLYHKHENLLIVSLRTLNKKIINQ